MNQVNYDFLCNDLKFLGFGDGLLPELKESMETEHHSFELTYRTKIDDDSVEALLYFTRPDPEGYFFFSKYEMLIAEKKHCFFIFKGKGVTVKEAYNLLDGRAVFKLRVGKNGQKYNEWIELDLSVKDDDGFRIIVYPESHGFDIIHAIDALRIETPSANWDRSMLIRSLERGNLQSAFVKHDDSFERVNIQADPKNLTIAIHEIAPAHWVKVEETKMGDDIEDALNTKKSRARKLKDVTR